MRIIKQYSAPTSEDLMQLKSQLNLTGSQMADLAGLAGADQWRKYTGVRQNQRSMSAQMLFYLAAQLVLDEKSLNDVVSKMRDIGAEII